MKQYLTAIFIICALVGCIKEQGLADDYRQRLVVEGHIENGRTAVVSLSVNISSRDEYNEESITDMIVRWAKVVVEDEDGRQEILTGRTNKDYPTKYIYTGSEIVGEVGRSYKLIVEYSGQAWEATTTIPQPAMLEDITIEHYKDSLYTISAVIPPIATPCSIDCSVDRSSYYAPTLLGVYNASNERRSITINRPLYNFVRDGYFTYFISNEEVVLRLNTLNDFGYTYRSEWENSMINSANPVFPSTNNMPTNLSNNGIGIWTGYGTTYHHVGKMPAD